jgi:hypothetical protein
MKKGLNLDYAPNIRLASTAKTYLISVHFASPRENFREAAE